VTEAPGGETLTLEALEQFLELPSDAEELHPYLDAASVLAAFDPVRLSPLDVPASEASHEAVFERLLPLCEPITEGPHRGLWSLKLADRRSALQRLGSTEQMTRALKANIRPDTALQAMFERVIGGQPIALEQLPREGLAALFTVREWVHDLVPGVPDADSLRRALTKYDLTAPLQRLVSDGFIDRDQELHQLTQYVSGPPMDTPLFIFGPGGVGKSTLMARFLLDQVEQRDAAFAYLDIDRPTIDPERPLTLLIEALAQLEPQFVAGTPTASTLAESIAESLGREERTRSFESHRPDDIWIDAFAQLLAAEPVNRTTIIVVDTFEEAQFLGTDVVWPLSYFLLTLARSAPSARVIISGRTLPAEYVSQAFADTFGPAGPENLDDEAGLNQISGPRRPINLGVLDVDAARELLASSLELAGLPSLARNDLDAVIRVVTPNPMCLKLAARLLRHEGAERLRSARSEVFARLRAEKIQALLYGRILHHVHGEDVKKIAYPGLIVRRITPEVIRKVLAGPCGLELSAERNEHVLFQALSDEAALVEVDPEDPDRSLRHRADVRRAMLEDLTDHVKPEVVEAIDNAAISYYRRRKGPIARAEEIYHRLRRRETDKTLEARWMPEAGSRLKNVGDEVPAQQRLWLAEKLGATLDASVREMASQETWEAQAARSVDRYLQGGLPEPALDLLRERSERLPRSELYSLEAEAYRFLGRHDEALAVARAGVESASDAGSIDIALELLLKMVVIEEGRDGRTAAKTLTEEAAAVATHSSNALLKLRTLVTRLRVDRRLRPAAHAARSELRLEALAMLTPEVLNELRSRPVLLQEVTAELGKDDAQLVSTAIETLGVDVESDAQAQALGQALWTLNSGKSPERTASPPLKGIESLKESEFDPDVIREWVTKILTSREARAIGVMLAASEPGAKVLREFRDYFREGVESSLRGPEDLSG
jgi:hypothetical protein